MSNIKANNPKWIGKKYVKLTVIGFVYKNNRWLWKCKCECGGESIAYPNQIMKGKTKTCGCGKSVTFHDMHLKHGYAGTRLYNIWKGIRKRCNNPNSKDYKDYGGRGISICMEWNDFVCFRVWALSHGYNDEMTIERINYNKNYCPENCTWIPNREQSYNTRNVMPVTYKGKTKPIGQWADEFGISRSTVYSRMRRGSDPLKALDINT